MTPPDDAPSTSYAAIADLLRTSRATFTQMAETHLWTPAVGSQAATDRTELENLDPNVSERDHLAGFDLVVEVAVTELEIAALHLEGMAAVYDRPWPFLTTDVVTRAIVEALGHALWMLAPTEIVDGKRIQVPATAAARGRLARAYLLHVASGVRDKQFDAVRKGQAKPGATRLVEARRRCRAAFPGATTARLEGSLSRPPRLDGEELPGLAAMVKLFFDTGRDHQALLLDEKETNAVYSYLSTAAHPTLFRVRELRNISVDEGRKALELKIPDAVASQPASMAVGLFYLVLRAFGNYFGYTADLTDPLADQINEVFPGTIY